MNWNGERYLDRLLQSLLSTAYEAFDILVVDNGSTDRSRAILKRYEAASSRVRVVLLGENVGFSGGNNAALQHLPSDTDYVCFLNFDCDVESGWLRALVDFMEAHPHAGVVQPKLLKLTDPSHIDRAATMVDKLGYDVYDIFVDSFDGPAYDQAREVFTASGAAFLVRRSILGKIALEGFVFDPTYFVYFEETDICWRARLAGYEVWYCPTSRVRHLRGASTRPNGHVPPHLVFHHTKNRLSALLKNYDTANLLVWVPGLVLFEVGRAAATFSTDRDHSLATLRGLAWVFCHWREVMHRRALVQGTIRKVPDRVATAKMIPPNPSLLILNYRQLYRENKRLSAAGPQG